LGLAGSTGGGIGANWAGGKVFGEGSDGQKLSALGGAVIGGLATIGGRQWFNARYLIKVEGWRVRFVPKLRPGDIELAQTAGVTREQIAARKRVAKVFAEDAGVPSEQLKNLIGEEGGIDLREPLRVKPFSAGDQVLQWSKPDKPPGNWVSLVDEHPSRLGISPEGRVQQLLRMDKDGLALESTAKSIVDTWTNPSSPYPAKGGGTQLFIPDKYKSMSPVGEPIKTWRDIPFFPD